jgi:hypothetical protein
MTVGVQVQNNLQSAANAIQLTCANRECGKLPIPLTWGEPQSHAMRLHFSVDTKIAVKVIRSGLWVVLPVAA